MAGTGEVWSHLLERFPAIGRIIAVDISSGMHRLAMERLHAHRAHHIDFIEDDVLASDLKDESADFIISTFGLKTFDAAQHARLAALVARCAEAGRQLLDDRSVRPEGLVAAPALSLPPADRPASWSSVCS